MGKSLADAMNAQPGPDSLAYWLAPLKGYWDRQGRMAQQGLQMADEGARAVRGGDFSGLGGALLGPVAYLASPINALFPERAEVDAATDVPSWSKPLIAGGLETMAIMAPGPKGPKGLGRGMASLADDATDAERAALAGRLEAEATQTGTGAVPVSRDQALTNLVEAPQGILAYHGSPHTFDKFDMSKIGTGEGAQAYGHGLYFAENEGVARSYRDALSKKLGFDTPERQAAADKFGRDFIEEMDGIGLDKDRLRQALEDTEFNAKRRLLDLGLKDVSELRPAPGDYSHILDPHTITKNLFDRAEKIREYMGSPYLVPRAGSMYQVRINAKPDEFLDWDRPLSEQPRGVQEAMRRADPSVPQHELGSELLRPLGRAHRGGKGGPGQSVAEAEALKAAGIKGIRYKDAGSRGAEGGTYNYVIFDDKLVDILKRYGVAMTAGAGGAMIVSGQNMPPDVAAQLDLQG